jgi:nucleotide-binding universal stress UspA family protein
MIGEQAMPDKPGKQRILVPVDFSAFSKAAVIKACEFASCMNLPVVILHVVHDPSQLPGYYVKLAEKKILVRIEDIASEMLDDFMRGMINDNPELDSLAAAEAMLVTGIPVTRILEVAERIDASMIVMGSQGRTGLSHVMLGSKAEQVVRLSPIPVTIVKINNEAHHAPEQTAWA